MSDLLCDRVVVAEPQDLGFRSGPSVTVKITWFTLLELAVLRPGYPHRRGYQHTQKHVFKHFMIMMVALNTVITSIVYKVLLRRQLQ